MFSLFVRGLMSATLLQVGLTSTFALIRQIGAPSAIQSFLWYIPGVFALPLAFLLFTSSALVYRLAFLYLAFLTQVFLFNLIFLPLYGIQNPVPLPTAIEGILGYSFPCVVALVERFRRRRSKQSLQRPAGRSVE